MADHGSIENGINWMDGHIEYKEFHTVLNEAVAGFSHLYAYDISKNTFLARLTGRPIHNLEDVNYPPPDSFNLEHWCTLSCHRFPKYSCATKNRAFPLLLVDVISAEERFRPMPTRFDTSYCRFCCSPINRPFASYALSLLLRWQLDANGPTPPMALQEPSGRCYVRCRRMRWSSRPPLNHPTSVPTGPPIRPSIPSGSCYVACSSATKKRPSTCLSVTTLHAIISPCWNSAPFGRAGRSPSFCPTNKSLRWRIVCLLYASPCVSAGTVSSSSARVATFVYTPP